MSNSTRKKLSQGPYYSFNASKTGTAQLKNHSTQKAAKKAALQMVSGKEISAIFGNRNKAGYHIVGLQQANTRTLKAAFLRAGIEAHEDTRHTPDHYYVFCYTEGRKVPHTDTTDYDVAEQSCDDHIASKPNHNATVITVQG